MSTASEAAAPAPANRLLALGTVVAAAALTVVGWRLLWHMADDAYISYRYLSNVMLGRGYTWNPAPFLPTDGNTDFAWSMLLLFVWRVFGIEPPDIANWLALGFGLSTLLLLARALWRLELPAPLARVRLPLLALALFVLATNRAWLATLSSGLGMAMFSTVMFAWTLLAASPRTVDDTRRWLLLGALAGLCGITRPEGYLVVGATALLGLWWGTARRAFVPGIVTALFAVVPMLAQMAWRKAVTGDMWPCSYHAKTVGAWPQSGVRFLLSFVVEFGVYVWLVPAAFWVVRKLRAPGPLVLLQPRHLGAAAAGGVLAVHFTYYTFFMGGDLFEWRVYSHLVPCLPLSFVLMVRSLPWRPATVLGVFGTHALLALPVGWIKYAVDDGPVAPHVPALLRPLLAPYDDWQAWLGDRLVCKRNYEMKVNMIALMGKAPPRAEGARVPMEGFPVYPANAAGYVGWVLPNVAIIDLHGLNDAVVARNPVASSAELLAERTAHWVNQFDAVDADHDGFVIEAELRPWLAVLAPSPPDRPEALEAAVRAMIRDDDGDEDGRLSRDEYVKNKRVHGDRLMTHDRVPPPGYLAGFRPNVQVHAGKVEVLPREVPLTADDIRRHEATFRERFGAPPP